VNTLIEQYKGKNGLKLSLKSVAPLELTNSIEYRATEIRHP